MARVAVRFSYDGSAFDSYARQPGRHTVEQALLDSFSQADVIDGPSSFRSGSRTDAGVSARVNVCRVETDAAPGRVGAADPVCDGLWFRSAIAAPEGFRVRHSIRREYRYFVPEDSDVDRARLQDALALFEGEHDFTAFSRVEPGRSPVRAVASAKFVADQGMICVVGRNFVWQQVRRMVQAALEVARGHLERGRVEAALRHPEAHAMFPPAPATNLVLWDVAYRGVSWPRMPAKNRNRLAAAAWAARMRTRLLGTNP